MRVTYDADKRATILIERGLDMRHAGKIFIGCHLTLPDERRDYRECRYITLGLLDERLVVAVWTLRGNSRRIISFRKANEREQKRYWEQVGRPG
ncbi:MAG: hypothetical protein ABS43_27605 [Bordetella sp. SCN 67-23]|nr:BrnT family toxin [Burkholderiales bacterium]ODS68706.1 MAG: hypothetical protein ABS43_27605 [Bordetella sp. SCN 67-23]OJW88758.1 MAG: hypothetical protein BGO71_04875 [Burkholderiales bacterium 67-32]